MSAVKHVTCEVGKTILYKVTIPHLKFANAVPNILKIISTNIIQYKEQAVNYKIFWLISNTRTFLWMPVNTVCFLLK